MSDTLEQAGRFADKLYKVYKSKGKHGEIYNDYLIECIQNCFWALAVEDHLPVFDKIWRILDERKYTAKNPFVYGDIDEGVWVEYPKEKDKKVIISTRYCSAADDNTHIFILEENDFPQMPEVKQTIFRVATVWPRQKSRKSIWGDDRDIVLPSLTTYKKRDYHYGYYDCRDKGHAILYKKYGTKDIGSMDNAHWDEGAISNALRTLRWHLEALKESTDNNNGEEK